MNSKSEKSVIITGAGTGIGAAAAKIFSEKNYHVYLLGRTLEKLETTAQGLSSATALACDLTDPESVKSICSRILSSNSSPPVQALINNAGIFRRHSFDEGSDEVWMSQWWSNMMGPVRITRELFSYFKKNRKGSIVNVSSTLGLRPSFETSAYSATKAAMVNWTQSLALEGASFNIRANCVCPGLVDTPIHDFHFLPPSEKEKVLQNLKNMQPLGRVGQPDEIARSVYFLASDESAWTTGAILSVDGGINLT